LIVINHTTYSKRQNNDTKISVWIYNETNVKHPHAGHAVKMKSLQSIKANRRTINGRLVYDHTWL